MYTISSEQVIGSYAVKYKTLVDLINKHYGGCTSTEIDIYIDLTDMLRSITHQPIICNGAYSIAASIINLCAHYRNFFNQYYGVYTRFFLIASEVNETSLNAKFVPGYNRYYHGDMPKINSLVDGALSILETLVPYINDIGIYRTNYEFGVFVYSILDYENRATVPVLILSKDPYTLQLVEDVSRLWVLRPRKKDNEDISFIITQKTALGSVLAQRKIGIYSNNINHDVQLLNVTLMPLVFALSGMPERRVRSIHRMPTVIKSLYNAVESGKILNDRTTDIRYVCSTLKENKWLNVTDPQRITERFNAIDIVSQYGVFKFDASTPKYTGMVNLYDPEAVKTINTTYFKDYPLDLNVL